ncbi:ribonuclease-domain-containing protein [Thozetella sp. PMI_491]|nr:ribonuclease-domain-containing protein [Thozetella sp. PMI_491]
MYFFSAFVTLLAAVPSVLSAPAEVAALEKRADAQCGSVYYTAAQVNAASVRACNHYNAGTTVGGYPHTFNNNEGFSFAVSGPYQEFPILSSGSLYTGGSPGADRVVINTSCKQAGTITHTGASGNAFVKCT